VVPVLLFSTDEVIRCGFIHRDHRPESGDPQLSAIHVHTPLTQLCPTEQQTSLQQGPSQQPVGKPMHGVWPLLH
jgi:hypothetical protein